MRFWPGQMLGRPVWLVLLLVAAGCATFDPEPLDQVPFRERAQTENQGGVTVSAAVLTEPETLRAFGVRMQREKIQPVWLRIRNDADHKYFFLPVALDPDYFSPHETSGRTIFSWADARTRRWSATSTISKFLSTSHTEARWCFRKAVGSLFMARPASV